MKHAQKLKNKSKKGSKKESKKDYTKKARKFPKKKIIIGKIYADWCGHCTVLKPEWEKMKTKIKSNMGRTLKNVEFDIVEMGDTSENQMRNITVQQLMDDFNKKHFPKGDKQVVSDGFPTMFRICKKRIEYYTGEKDATELYNWFTRKC